jgi:hypothetical protein
MAEISSSTYSETDASNNTASPDGWPEGMAMSGLNNSGRQMMGALKRFWGRIQGAYASTGSSNAYVLTPTVALSAYVTGERYSFRSNFSNTGAATLNISSLGAKTIKKYTASGKADLAADDIRSGQPVTVEYDGTDLVMVTPVANTLTVAATQSDMETATSTTTAVTPGVVKNHPGVAKAWVSFNGTGTLAVNASHNVSSVTDNNTGDYTVNFTTAFSSANYAVIALADIASGATRNTPATVNIHTKSTSSCRILLHDATATPQDFEIVDLVFFGDQ